MGRADDGDGGARLNPNGPDETSEHFFMGI
jgi:hypothetical protein